MESWTFLIQQEGDNVWLPLESSGSEVLEGRYRVMARTAQVNCPLSVKISHLDLDVLPPSRRVLKRQTRTNAKGLVALLPFTLLKPGVWDIHCQWRANDASVEQSAKPVVRKQTLKLQVLEQEDGADLDGAEFYPQDLHELDMPDVIAHDHAPVPQPSMESEDMLHSLEQSLVPAPDLDDDRLEDAELITDSDAESADDLLQDLMDGVSSESISTDDDLQELATELNQFPSEDELAVQPTEELDMSSHLLQDVPLAATQPEASLSQSSDGLPTSDEADALAPTDEGWLDSDEADASVPADEEMAIDNDEMQVLLDTADQMAAHIIETMNAELHRIHHNAPPSISSLPSDSTPSISSEAGDQTGSLPQPSASSSDSPEYLLPVPSTTRQPIWDVTALKRLGLTISLARDCYTVVNDQLILTGMIEGEAFIEPTGTELQDPPQAPATSQPSPDLAGLTLGLRVNLIQPQSGSCLLEHDVALPMSTLPTPFSVLMDIPPNLNTHVLVGEVILAMATDPGMDGQSPESRQPQVNVGASDLEGTLAHQSFTVTVELGTLLDTVQSQQQVMTPQRDTVAPTTAEAEPLLPVSTSMAAESDDIDTPAIETRELQPVGYSPLPPKLTTFSVDDTRQPPSVPSESSTSGESISQSTLDLPHFLRSGGDRPPSPMAIAIAQAMQASASAPPTEDAQVEDPPSPPPEVQPSPIIEPIIEGAVEPRDESEDPGDLHLMTEAGDGIPDDLPASPVDLSPPEPVIESLDAAQTVPVESESSSLSPSQSAELSQSVDSSQDIAVDSRSLMSGLDLSENPFGPLLDEDVTQHERTPAAVQASSVSLEEPKEETLAPDPVHPASQPQTTVCPPLPDYIPIPTPTLVVPQEELVAGMPVRISVTLPASIMGSEIVDGGSSGTRSSVSLIFVKLWVQDRQTRSILDGPRWLLDFIPNQAGQLEAMTQLVLPIGCLEVSIEAIAVEMATQRESHKTTLHRSILPSTMPNSLTIFDFDDLN